MAARGVRPNLLAGEDLLPEPRQRRSVAKRLAIKTAALALFAEKGYEATSIEDIVRRAKLATGGFYQHYRSKRQLLLSLMDDLLEYMSRLDLSPGGAIGVRAMLHGLLVRAFAGDLRYLGAYRAWEEATLSDPDLARKDRQIHAWTTARLLRLFEFLHTLPGARPEVALAVLARVMDNFFWGLLARAVRARQAELNEWIDTSAGLIYHALFTDPAPHRTQNRPMN